MKKLKKLLLKLWLLDSQVRIHILITKKAYRVPIIGRLLGLMLDRAIFIVYGLYVYSDTINVKYLAVGQPAAVQLAGYGIYSPGRVRILAGVRLTAKKPDDPEYIRLYNENKVFQFGDNVVIGVGSIVLGPISICDNVMIGAGSFVNKSITEPGVYVGNPLRKISDKIDNSWFK